MRSLVLSVICLGLSATMSIANAQDVNVKLGNKIPFNVEFRGLSAYLDLDPIQLDEVYNINEYFVREQQKSLSKDAKRQEEKLRKAVYGNLKLMREVLTADQYQKYVTILNVTNNNNRLATSTSLEDIYLAEND